jgi:AcrR family transcriptional regulator
VQLNYKKPLQPRAIATEEKFLQALNDLLQSKSFGQITTQNIAAQAQLTRSAFIKRFGSKKQALLILWQQYCDECAVAMQSFIGSLPTKTAPLEEVCSEISATLEQLQLKHFAANRAINEHFMEDLEVAEPTKIVFLASVEMMRCVQKRFLLGTGASDMGAFAAAQISLTINYNYTIKAMPALPKDPAIRHRLIGIHIANSLKL